MAANALGCTCSKGRQGQEAYNEGNECEEEAHEALHLVVQPAIRREYSYYHATSGSGSETRAHLMASDDKRLTIMFCAFEGPPVVLRLYGQGRSLMRGTPEYADLAPRFEEMTGARQIVRLSVDLVQTSCGMGVPLFDYKQERGSLVRYWTAQGIKNLRKYWGLKNVKSIDGLPTGFVPDSMAPPT